MKTYLVARHVGTIEWCNAKNIQIDVYLQHLEPEVIQPEDVVIGTLPINYAAEICKKGARYLHLSLEVPFEMRGKELSAEDLEKFGAQIEEYQVIKVLC